MELDTNLLAALISGAVAIGIAVIGGGLAIFVRQRATEMKIDANHASSEIRFRGVEDRLEMIEKDIGGIADIRADVSYIRGFLDGENGARSGAKAPS